MATLTGRQAPPTSWARHRHVTCATKDASLPLDELHSDISVTMRYVHIDDQLVRAAIVCAPAPIARPLNKSRERSPCFR